MAFGSLCERANELRRGAVALFQIPVSLTWVCGHFLDLLGNLSVKAGELPPSLFSREELRFPCLRMGFIAILQDELLGRRDHVIPVIPVIPASDFFVHGGLSGCTVAA